MFKKLSTWLFLVMFVTLLSACGGGSTSGDTPAPAPLPSSPVTIVFPGNGQNVLAPGASVQFAVVLNPEQVRSLKSSFVSATSANVSLTILGVESNAYTLSPASFNLDAGNTTQTVLLTISNNATASSFGENAQLVANVNGYQSSAPVELVFVPSTPAITFDTNNVTMGTGRTTNVVLVGKNLTSPTVVSLAASNGLITVSPSSCTLGVGSSSTCTVTLNSSQNTGDDQIIATASGFTIEALDINVFSPGTIALEASDDNPTILGGTTETVVVTLKSFELSSYPATISLSTSSSSLVLDTTSCILENTISECQINVSSAVDYAAGNYQINATAIVDGLQVSAEPLTVKVIKPGSIYFDVNQKLPLFIGDTSQVELVIDGSSDTRTLTIPLQMTGTSGATYTTNNQADPSVCIFQPSQGVNTCTITINAGNSAGDSVLTATDTYTGIAIAPLVIEVFDSPQASFAKAAYFVDPFATVYPQIVYNTNFFGEFTISKTYTLTSPNNRTIDNGGVDTCFTFVPQQTCTFTNTNKQCSIAVKMESNSFRCSLNKDVILNAQDQDGNIISTLINPSNP